MRSVSQSLFLWIGFVGTAVIGCERAHKSETTSVAQPPTVRLMTPALRNIVRIVGQPSFVEAYERTAIYPKMSAYIEKWYVDIGDKVKKNQVLADLFVPEIREDFLTKKATIALDEQHVELAKEAVIVATADVKASEARLKSVRAILGQYEAEVTRWDSEVQRLSRESKRGVVDVQGVARIAKTVEVGHRLARLCGSRHRAGRG